MTEFRPSDAGASVDQIVRELAADFETTPVDMIEQLVAGSFVELAEGARIDTYLPVLAKRVVRERLRHRDPSAA
jgi:uncharacterized protein DUF3562/protein-tyrosine phosphatase-like protein